MRLCITAAAALLCCTRGQTWSRAKVTFRIGFLYTIPMRAVYVCTPSTRRPIMHCRHARDSPVESSSTSLFPCADDSVDSSLVYRHRERRWSPIKVPYQHKALIKVPNCRMSDGITVRAIATGEREKWVDCKISRESLDYSQSVSGARSAETAAHRHARVSAKSVRVSSTHSLWCRAGDRLDSTYTIAPQQSDRERNKTRAVSATTSQIVIRDNDKAAEHRRACATTKRETTTSARNKFDRLQETGIENINEWCDRVCLIIHLADEQQYSYAWYMYVRAHVPVRGKKEEQENTAILQGAFIEVLVREPSELKSRGGSTRSNNQLGDSQKCQRLDSGAVRTSLCIRYTYIICADKNRFSRRKNRARLAKMRNLERVSVSDQDSIDQEMYIDLDDVSVDSLSGKRSRTHLTEVGDESDSSGSERGAKRSKRRNRGTSSSTSANRRRKSGISARERTLRRLESNERERMRMHSLNDAFEIRRRVRVKQRRQQSWSAGAKRARASRRRRIIAVIGARDQQ
ncbi:unnamed protein product [Trichogramma brassicae]|uniref:Uncharacterized protein n=1 Tax=Trichogramma brassicae TaxID=86971 RepID=A0A6H5HUK7_9HYME|nr:unnamed protein product [Trichogramma brassicae]